MNRYARTSAMILWALLAAVSCGRPGGPGSETAGPGSAASAAIGIDEIARLDLLPRLQALGPGRARLELRPDGRQRRRLQRQVLVRPQGAGRPRPGRPRGPRRYLPHPHADADRRHRRVLSSTARRRRASAEGHRALRRHARRRSSRRSSARASAATPATCR
ncbi:MAG: hypothetical protein MZW92_03120 [Comamonadaceae bacterium]|nr:hypothetical protein [Comamonadaceae bacterium]